MTPAFSHSAVVNGPLGTVGMALVRCLLARGADVTAVCYPGDFRISYLPTGVHIIQLDMREIEKLPQLLHYKANSFYHLAWMGTIGPSRNDAGVQAENIRCAVAAARVASDLGCEVFVGVGSQAEYGQIEGLVTPDAPCNPTNGYGIAKLCAGQLTRLYCRNVGIRHIWARILSAYGPGDGPLSVIPTIISHLLRGEKPSLTPGEQLWDFCYCDDVAEALIRLADRGKDGDIYPIGSGRVRPLREYFEIIRNSIDPTLPLGIGELPYPENQVMHLQADLASLLRDTGFIPQISFEEGILRTIKAFREEMNT